MVGEDATALPVEGFGAAANDDDPDPGADDDAPHDVCAESPVLIVVS